MNDHQKSSGLHTRVLPILGVIILLHVCLAAWLAQLTPYRQAGVLSYDPAKAIQVDIGAPDERQHVNYVMHVARGDGFPVFDFKDLSTLSENVENHQPPVFYVLAAGWSKVLGANDLQLHDDGLKLRAFNVVLGSIGVAGVFFLGYWGFRSAEIGLLAAAFAALLPSNVALSSAVSNDVLLIALCSWVLALCGKALHEGWNTRLLVLTGVLTGIALLTKTTALALLPILLIAIWMKRDQGSWIKSVGIACGIAVLIATPWWARNQSLYGDPFALKAFNMAFVNTAQASTFVSSYGLFGYLAGWVGWWGIRSFFGAFGYMDIFLNETGRPMSDTPNTLYRLLIVVSGVVFLGWLLSFKDSESKEDRTTHLLLGVFTAFIVVLFLKFNLQYFQAQARYILPALGPIACAFAIGARRLLKNRWVAALALILAVFGGVSVYAEVRLPSEFAIRVR